MRLTLRAGAVASATLLDLSPLSACGSDSKNSSAAAPAGGKCTSPTTLKTSLVPLYPLIQVGTDAGIFAKHCLAVENTPATSPVAAIPAILGGSVDLTLLPLFNVVSSLNQKVPLKIVAPGAEIPANAGTLPPSKVDAAGVFVPKGSSTTSPKDLTGKTVAVPGLGTSMQAGIKAAISAAGGDPSTVKWVAFDSATELQQLKAGKVAAAGLAIPFSTQAAKEGLLQIAAPSLALYGPGLAYTPWVTSERNLAARAEPLKRFREAIREVQAYSTEHMDVYQTKQSSLTKIPLEAIKAGPSTWFATEIKSEDVTAFAAKLKTLGLVEQVPDLSNVVATFK